MATDMHAQGPVRARAATAAVPRPGGQRGAVLYVALIMLVLLALIGIAGMQVAGMQERMAANYLRSNVAFQAAEGQVRVKEDEIAEGLYTHGAFTADQEACEPSFDPLTWANEQVSGGGMSHTRRLDKCFPSSSIVVGSSVSDDTGNIYEISAQSLDDPDSPGATAVINTIYIP